MENTVIALISPPPASDIFNRTLGYKSYEEANHLGNVLAVVSDCKIVHSTNGSTIDYFLPEIIVSNDYYSFGAILQGRQFISGINYKFNFNGKESDKEIVGTAQGTQDYGMRIYNPSLGRFLNVDPLSDKYPYYSPYHFAGNRPIGAIDIDGMEPADITKGTQNLIIVVQGYGGGMGRNNPKNGSTQVDNAGKDYAGNARDGGLVTFASSPTGNTETDILNTVKSFKKENPTGKVILVGHSLGAYNITNVVNFNTEIKYDLVITVDPSGADYFNGASTGSQRMLNNVKNAINYRNPVRSGTAGGEISYDKDTNGANIDVKGTTHTNIDDTMLPYIVGDILRAVLGLDAVKNAKQRDPSKIKAVSNSTNDKGGSSY